LSDVFKNRGTTITVPGQQRSDAAPKKLLVCAPSNAAVDELVMRFKNGIKTLNGEERKLNIVRLGRGDAINANVQDVCLEELVSKKLGLNPDKGKDQEATRKLFEDHKKVSAQLNMVRDQLNSGEVKGDALSKLQDDMNQLKKQKATLGTRIDNTKDDERLASRISTAVEHKTRSSMMLTSSVLH
jgi:senataxin